MHDPNASGNASFLCDFCHQPWSDDRAMVEGHRGSLICANCLSIAYTEIIHLKLGSAVSPDEKCVLCLEHGRDDPHWRSPMYDEAIACRRCLKQSAGVLHKDADINWSKPLDPSLEQH
jgi:hypothetical protein